jgi:hypothetical protein
MAPFLTPSQSKTSVENSAEMKLPGRKNMVTKASVFIEAASRRVDIEMRVLERL